MIHVIQIYRETSYKIEILFDIWRHFQRYFFVFPYILPKVPNIAESANIADFFQKTFGDIIDVMSFSSMIR